MQNYLFLILDRHEASFTRSFEIKSSLSNTKTIFRNCMMEKAHYTEEEYADIADEICKRGKMTTHDGEEVSYLLIKLEN